mgnify:CR=1 FL=1
MTKKLRRHTQRKLTSLTYLLKIQQKLKIKEKLFTFQNSFLLTETDKIIWIYKRNESGVVVEVTCVGYEILLGNDWITIIYYDSFHGGLLHRHMRISLEDDSDVVSESGVKRSGSQKELLTWAMKNLRTRYLEYKRSFIKNE